MLTKYSELLSLMRSLNKTNEEQNASSKELTAAVKTLEKNSKLGACAWLWFTASLT